MSQTKNKFRQKISLLIGRLRHSIKVGKRKKVHTRIVRNKETDFDRWKQNDELHENWNERTAILADYVNSNSKIIEFGAGNMFLKDYLKPIHYTPTDIVKRFENTLVCDLNQEIEIDLSGYETAVFSGVLEYVHNIDHVFNQMNSFNINQVVLSYCCSDINKASRLLNGWFSDLTRADLETIFGKYNYKILDYKEWKEQSIYNLKLNN